MKLFRLFLLFNWTSLIALTIILLSSIIRTNGETNGDGDDGKQRVGNSQPKSVSVELFAKWSETPMHLEASEFLAEENNDFFWQFIDVVHDELKTDDNKSNANAKVNVMANKTPATQ